MPSGYRSNIEFPQIAFKPFSTALNGRFPIYSPHSKTPPRSGLNFCAARQAEIRRIEKKYGKSYGGTRSPTWMSFGENLNLSDNYDLEIERLQLRVDEATDQLREKAEILHAARESESAPGLGEKIVTELRKLGITHAAFQTKVEWLYSNDGWLTIGNRRVSCSEYGGDEVRFYISTNKGEVPKPLSKTASGGEISRIMLALKSILARSSRCR